MTDSRPGYGKRRPTRHWPPQIPDAAWAPVTTALLLLLVGVVGVLFDQPFLFPSLGPTAFLKAEYPDSRAAGFYHTVAGHLIGLVSGVLAALLFGTARHVGSGLPRMSSDLVLAAAFAVALTILVELVVHASHPPAASTTLLFALGKFQPNPHDVLTVVVGVLIVATAGELLRRTRLGGGVADLT
jgi:hypothetical protein